MQDYRMLVNYDIRTDRLGDDIEGVVGGVDHHLPGNQHMTKWHNYSVLAMLQVRSSDIKAAIHWMQFVFLGAFQVSRS
jgi:hypothetical protein